MARKFTHEESYRGKDLLDKLAKKQIILCGAGALGSNLADMLCRQGVSKLRVIDMDRVEVHNIGTQIYGDADVGAMKVAALKNRIFRDSGVEIEVVDKELREGNAKKFLKGADLVLDTFDNNKSRQMIRDHCRSEKLNLLHLGLNDSYGECIWDEYYKVPSDSVEGNTCDYPLSRTIILILVCIGAEEVMRYCIDNLKDRNWSITLKDLSIKRMSLSYI